MINTALKVPFTKATRRSTTYIYLLKVPIVSAMKATWSQVTVPRMGLILKKGWECGNGHRGAGLFELV